MTKEEIEEMAILDKNSDGLYTDPEAHIDLDMLAVREYMKKNNLKGPLKDEELKPFMR